MYSILPGKTYPLGASFDGAGTNFAVFSCHATAIEVCLFDASGAEEMQRLRLPVYENDIWCGYIPGVTPGMLYGLRAHGAYSPHEGLRFNPHKLLLDPYARELSSPLHFHPSQLAYCNSTQHDCDLMMDTTDSAPTMPKCIVTLEPEDADEERPNIPLSDTIFYEMHARGFSQQNPAVNDDKRGSYLGLADPASIQHIKSLGVTSVELLPVHASCAEPFLAEQGRPNYWGYNSYHFFALQPRYAQMQAFKELRQVVQTMHKAGLEVIIDVVYNHTAEGNHLGPTYSFKGLDNASYYHLMEGDKRFYANHTGCGNSVNLTHPRVLQFVMDSLRYLVQKVGVDGFRFDLATTLGRNQQHYFTAQHAFFAAVTQDPVLAKVKMIAEPWDIGYNGYQVGNFPNGWHEWNDKFRDTVRRFWLTNDAMAPEFARRMHGSSDVFERPGRTAYTSVNFISAHDGFTLKDLVSYNERHNFANGEDNRDGHGANFSYNHGVEGPTNNPAIKQIRLRQQKNMLASLLLSQGIPMLLAGDEFGNSQSGNNNAYCQDNEISWLNWQDIDADARELQDFTAELIRLRRLHPLLNRPRYQHGSHISPLTGLPDISWLNSDGSNMTQETWQREDLKCFGMLLAATGENHEVRSYHSSCSIDDALLFIFNAGNEAMRFQLPTLNGVWQKILDTGERLDDGSSIHHQKPLKLQGKSFVVLSYIHKASAPEENH
ncbi:MAG: glycogen debranching protein GlgX [Pseudomonadota bacterium]